LKLTKKREAVGTTPRKKYSREVEQNFGSPDNMKREESVKIRGHAVNNGSNGPGGGAETAKCFTEAVRGGNRKGRTQPEKNLKPAAVRCRPKLGHPCCNLEGPGHLGWERAGVRWQLYLL